jgi:hypothetical protein
MMYGASLYVPSGDSETNTVDTLATRASAPALFLLASSLSCDIVWCFGLDFPSASPPSCKDRAGGQKHKIRAAHAERQRIQDSESAHGQLPKSGLGSESNCTPATLVHTTGGPPRYPGGRYSGNPNLRYASSPLVSIHADIHPSVHPPTAPAHLSKGGRAGRQACMHACISSPTSTLPNLLCEQHPIQ